MADAHEQVIALYKQLQKMLADRNGDLPIRHYIDTVKNVDGATGGRDGDARARGVATEKTEIKQKREKVLLRWCQTLLTTMTYDVFEAFRDSDFVKESAEYIFNHLKVVGDVKQLRIQDVNGEMTTLDNPDIETLKKFDNLHDIIGIYSSNPADLIFLRALIAIKSDQGATDVQQSRQQIQNNLKTLVTVAFSETPPTPYEKPKVTPLQHDIYTYTSFFLHKIGYVQSSAFFLITNLNVHTFYDNYLQYHPDALAYCLVQPVLTLCVYQFENGIVDPSLCTLFVCFCLISVTDASNIKSATGELGQQAHFKLEHDFKYHVTKVLTKAYTSEQKSISAHSEQTYDLQKVHTISNVFQHCHKLFSNQLYQLLAQCLRFNNYFDGVDVVSSASAPVALHELIQELPVFSLKLRFV